MAKKIMIIGAGEMQIPIIIKTKELGFYTITIDINIKAPGNKYADLALEIDTNDKDSILEHAKKHKIDGILTTSDLPVRVVAYVSKKLGLFGLTEKAAEICTDKYLLRNHFKKHNFLTPKYQLIDNFNFDATKIDYFPVVVKPVDSSASRGVSKVEKIEDLNAAIEFANVYSKTNRVIVEEFIEGKEYSVETFTQKKITTIIAITEKETAGENNKYFVEDRHIIHADLSATEEIRVKKRVNEIVNSLQIGDSSTHTELKINNKGIFVIEVGARLGGDFITSNLVPLSTGVDMLSNTIKLALGEPIDVIPKFHKFSGVQFINSQNYFLIKNYIKKSVHKISEYHIEPYAETELKSSLDRLGYFIASSDKRDDLIQILNCNHK